MQSQQYKIAQFTRKLDNLQLEWHNILYQINT